MVYSHFLNVTVGTLTSFGRAFGAPGCTAEIGRLRCGIAAHWTDEGDVDGTDLSSAECGLPGCGEPCAGGGRPVGGDGQIALDLGELEPEVSHQDDQPRANMNFFETFLKSLNI
jgi:hypothetical protein